MSFKFINRIVAIKFLGLFSYNGQNQVPETGEDSNVCSVFVEQKVRKCPKTVNPQFSHAIDAGTGEINRQLMLKGIPGMTVCVSMKGQTVWSSAFGYCDVENQVACRHDARMRIASISKPLFVSTVIGPLIDKNEIDLGSSIHKFISEQEFPRKKFDNKEVDITIEQLITHTSGIVHYDEGRGEDKPLRPIGSAGSQKVYQCEDQFNRKGFFQRKTFRSVVEALEPFKNLPIGEPGKYSYTTYGYTLLSAVIEKLYQQPKSNANDECSRQTQIEDLWTKTLRNVWGLSETCLDQDEPLIPNRARYYLRTAENGSLVNAPYTDNSVKWAGGGVVSSTSDLVKFGNALIDSYKGRQGSKLKSETVKQLWAPRVADYALGFSVLKLKPRQNRQEEFAVYHLGGALGASSALIIYPESEIVVAILTNLGSVNLRALGLFIADQFVELRANKNSE